MCDSLHTGRYGTTITADLEAAPQPTLGHYRESSLTHPKSTTAFLHTQPGHRESHEVGSLSLAEHLVRFEPGTLQF